MRTLIDEKIELVATDLVLDTARPSLLLSPEELEDTTLVSLDVTDRKAVYDTVVQYEITHVIHLAALQVPFCKADPSRGALVNVAGTVNVLEAVRAAGEQVRGLAYASSIAVLGPEELYTAPVGDAAMRQPTTLYGVYKVANEETARIYNADWNVASVGLRPYIVFGVGRDQGLTSDVAKSILAAVAGRPFQIQFDGKVALQYARDVAKIFIDAARHCPRRAIVCNLRQDVVEIKTFLQELLDQFPDAQVSFKPGCPLPFPAEIDDSGLRKVLPAIPHTPLREAIRETATLYRTLLAKQGRTLEELNL